MTHPYPLTPVMPATPATPRARATNPVRLAAVACGALLAAGLASPSAAADAHRHGTGAHVHGEARLTVAVEGGGFTVGLETPLDNLVGIERAPRTAAERARVDQALATLRDAGRLFVADAAAGCRAGTPEIESAVLGLPAPAAGAAPATKASGDGHADLDATVTFTCTDPSRLASLDIALFDAFPRLRKLQVAVTGPKGQSGRTLTPSARRLALAR